MLRHISKQWVQWNCNWKTKNISGNKPGKHSTNYLKKNSCIKHIAHNKEVSQSETWSLNGGVHHWFKREVPGGKETYGIKNNTRNRTAATITTTTTDQDILLFLVTQWTRTKSVGFTGCHSVFLLPKCVHLQPSFWQLPLSFLRRLTLYFTHFPLTKPFWSSFKAYMARKRNNTVQVSLTQIFQFTCCFIYVITNEGWIPLKQRSALGMKPTPMSTTSIKSILILFYNLLLGSFFNTFTHQNSVCIPRFPCPILNQHSFWSSRHPELGV